MAAFAPADLLQIKLRSLTEAQALLQKYEKPTVKDLIDTARTIEAYYLEADKPTPVELPRKN